MKHELKVWPEFFSDIKRGAKTFEVRRNDRGFEVGDALRLCEYDPGLERFTGNTIEVDVTYILYGPGFGVKDGVCVMSIKERSEAAELGEQILRLRGLRDKGSFVRGEVMKMFPHDDPFGPTISHPQTVLQWYMHALLHATSAELKQAIDEVKG